METPRHPAGPAFEKATDAMEAWRQQQIAALTETQRRLYEEACRKAREREEAKAKELEQRRLADIQERMRKKILERPSLELVLDGKRTRITEVLARQLIAEYFQPGRPQNLTQFEMMTRQAAQAAAREIEQEHARELEAFKSEERGKTDGLLQSFERARQAQPERRDEFARAAAEGRAKTDFGEAARDDGVRQDPIRSEAIARAIARVKEKEEEERERGNRDQDRGRSLTDTFNRTR